MPRRPSAPFDALRAPRACRGAESIGRRYDEFGAALYRYALMILADPAGAADVVQQVFVAMLGRNDVRTAEHYLRRAVRNECYSLLRRKRREPAPPAGAPLIEPLADGADPDLRMTIEHALSTLPADQREVVHLKVFEGFTFDEIAAMTEESINTVASRYRYAMDKLRAQLGAKR